jgi:MinD-like ATPase involved in chromosome partitioning or flagellar assembly
VLVSCWSAKGGVGTTVVAAALGLVLARSSPAGALLVDIGGDLPAVLGLREPEGSGLSDWFAAGADVPLDALGRLEVAAGPGLHVLPRGAGPFEPNPGGGDRAGVLAGLLAADGRAVVVDCGAGPSGPGLTLASEATHSLLVTRTCFLALRRALAAPLRPSGVVLVAEEGRVLRRGDVEEILGVPVRAQIPYDKTVARAVDAGLLCCRLPSLLDRPLRAAA